MDVCTPIIYRHSGVLVTFEITLIMIHDDFSHIHNLGIRTEQEALELSAGALAPLPRNKRKDGLA